MPEMEVAERKWYDETVRIWQDRRIRSAEDLDVVLSDYRVLFAYHSNKIEDAGVSFYQTREIFENGKVVGYTGDLRAIFETENQRVCYEFLKDKIIGREKLTPALVCEIQELLCHGCYDEARWKKGERPGEYKKHFYGVGLSVGVPPEDVPDEMEYICRELSTVRTGEPENIIKTAAWFHCSFERIHAFADGNGRVGRTLLNYVLMTGNLPPTVLFDEDKETYYMALEVFDHTDEIDGFVAFLKEQMVKTWTRTDAHGGRYVAI